MAPLKKLENFYKSNKEEFQRITGLKVEENEQAYLQFLTLEMMNKIESNTSEISSLESKMDDLVKILKEGR
jgi:hypothetical protein